jgi:hypothetical protein
MLVSCLLVSCLLVSCSLGTMEMDTSEILRRINTLRAAHNAPAVSWGPALAEYAAAWAGALSLSVPPSPDRLRRSLGNAYGENVAAVPVQDGGTSAAVLAAVDAWYAEGAAYSYAVPTYADATANFTQLVWASTRYVGAAVSARGVVVMEFAPSGNMVGGFASNVRPPNGTLPSSCSCTCY